jgi:hypothetical protein
MFSVVAAKNTRPTRQRGQKPIGPVDMKGRPRGLKKFFCNLNSAPMGKSGKKACEHQNNYAHDSGTTDASASESPAPLLNMTVMTYRTRLTPGPRSDLRSSLQVCQGGDAVRAEADSFFRVLTAAAAAAAAAAAVRAALSLPVSPSRISCAAQKRRTHAPKEKTFSYSPPSPPTPPPSPPPSPPRSAPV